MKADKSISVLAENEFLDRVAKSLQANSGGAADSSTFTFVLGAGFSHGIISSAREIVRDLPVWLGRELRDMKAPPEYAVEFWSKLNEQKRDTKEQLIDLNDEGVPDLRDGDSVSYAYSSAMLQGLGTPYFRRMYFRHLCDQTNGNVNLAHLYLASILRAQDTDAWRERYGRFCTTIFTTNFDPLLQIALQLVNKLYYMTDRPQTLETPYDDDRAAIHLIYTHGSIHQAAIANTQQEIQKFAKMQAAHLPSYFKRHGVIVLGYSGWNDACMAALKRCDLFDHNLYWCDLHSSKEMNKQLRSNVIKFLGNHRGNAFYVPIRNCNDLMQKMHQMLEGNAVPSMLKEPLPPMLDRLRQIQRTLESERAPAPSRENEMREMGGVDDVISVTVKNLEQAISRWSSTDVPALSKTSASPTDSPAEKRAVTTLQDAHFLVLAGRENDAMAIWEKIIESPQSRPEIRAQALFSRAVAKGRSDSEGEIADYTAVIEMKDAPSELRAMSLNNRGVTKRMKGNRDGAIADYTSVVEMEDASPTQLAIALNNRGVAKDAKGDLDGAVADYAAVIDMKDAPPKQRAMALYNRGIARDKQKNPHGAIADYTAIIDMKDAPPDQRAMAFFNRGTIKDLMGEANSAFADYTAIIDMKDAPIKERAMALVNRGIAKDRQGDRNGAFSDFAAAIDIKDVGAEQRARALNNRGVAKSKHGDSSGAVADYTSVIEMKDVPAELRAQAFGGRGWVFYNDGKFEQSIADAKEALVLDSSKSWIRANLGLALLHIGHDAESRKEYEQALAELDSPEKVDSVVISDLQQALANKSDLVGVKDIIELAEQRKLQLSGKPNDAN